jgi:hypothetical protein
MRENERMERVAEASVRERVAGRDAGARATREAKGASRIALAHELPQLQRQGTRAQSEGA